MQVLNIPQLTAFLNQYEPGLYEHRTRKPRYQLGLQSPFIRETVPAICLNYGDRLLGNQWETSYIVSPPAVVKEAIQLQVFTWDNLNNCGEIKTILVAPDSPFQRIKGGKITADFDVMARAIQLKASKQDNSFTSDDFKKVIWYVQNSKHPIWRLLTTSIDELGANLLHDWVERNINFE